MKLTKGMKKALSLLLSAAMVVTGVNVTTNTASAAGSDATATSYKIEFTAATSAGEKDADGKYDETYLPGASATVNSSDMTLKNNPGWSMEGTEARFSTEIQTAIRNFSKPMIKVTEISDNATLKMLDFNWEDTISNDGWASANGYTLTKGKEAALQTDKKNADTFGFFLTIGGSAKIEVYDAAPATEATATAEATAKATATATATAKATAAASASSAAVTSGASAAPSTKPAVEPSAPATTATEAPTKAPATATPEPTEKPDEENQAFLMFADKDYKWGNWNTKVCGGNGKDATITGNGTYTVSINKEDFADQEAVAAPANGATVFGVDIMGICATQKFDASKMALSDVVVKCDGKEVKTIDFSKMYEGSIEGGKNDNYRLEIRNEWGYGDGEFATKDEFDEANPNFTFEKSLSVTFTVKGIKKGATPKDAFKTADGKYAVSKGGERAKVADVADVVKTAAPSTKPAVTTTKPAVTTKPAITTAAAVKGTSKLTVAKKLVVVAPNKSVKVAFKATKAKNTSGAAVVKATSKSKKVATVKVKGKNVIIKAPKKAVKGASTTVTLKSTKANGKAISAKIKVYVRNSAKKVKAAKKSITVKKGKTTKLVVKASKVQNKKKAFADTITVKGKVLKLTAVKYAKGKATLTLKGAKKAKKKVVKIKVGKKTVKVKATVK